MSFRHRHPMAQSANRLSLIFILRESLAIVLFTQKNTIICVSPVLSTLILPPRFSSSPFASHYFLSLYSPISDCKMCVAKLCLLLSPFSLLPVAIVYSNKEFVIFLSPLVFLSSAVNGKATTSAFHAWSHAH